MIKMPRIKKYQHRIILFLIVSVLTHGIVFFISKKVLKPASTKLNPRSKPTPISLKLTKPKKKKKKLTKKINPLKKSKAPIEKKMIVETPMKKTLPPKEYRFLGKQNHSTEKETKLPPSKPALAQKTPPSSMKKKVRPPIKKEPPKTTLPKNQPLKHTKHFESGNLNINPKTGKKNLKEISYKDLFPSPANMLDTKNSPSSEYISDDIEEGDRVSLNTREFKYISYFSTIKRQIELIWKYPEAAYKKGMQGETTLEITINKDGRLGKVMVLKSSGYAELDNEAVNTIRLCSPFNPIPENLNKDRLIITGTFVYRLSYFSVN